MQMDEKLKNFGLIVLKSTLVQSLVTYTPFLHPCAFLLPVRVSLSSSKSLSRYWDIFQLIL